MRGADGPGLRDIELCFEGAVPAVIATAAADGTPNVTYLSRVQLVDDERVALSNQFFSKTARNLAENPRASVLLLDPVDFREFRLSLVYERTERRGPVFERLRADIVALAALEGLEGVFKLRAADIYRVEHIEQVPSVGFPVGAGGEGGAEDGSGDAARLDRAGRSGPDPAALAELARRLGRAGDLDAIVGTTVDGLADLLGYDHSLLLLLDEQGRRLYTIASRGYESEGVGSEVVVGEGMIGMAAARGVPLRIGNLRQMEKYSRSVRRSFERTGAVAAACEVPVPGLPGAQSWVAVPAMALGQLVGVLLVESTRPVAFTAGDEAALTMVAALVANALEAQRAIERAEEPAPMPLAAAPGEPAVAAGGPATHVRFFPVDGSTFLDGDYLIKGVAGRILWSLLRAHTEEGRTEFTNREVRLDPSLELPAFRDNLESRLILLKRRLDERDAPVRIEKSGRGRFQLAVTVPLRLDPADP